MFNVGTRPRGKEKDRILAHTPGTTTLRTEIVTWAGSLMNIAAALAELTE